MWQPTDVVESEWGRLAVFVDGVDRTVLRVVDGEPVLAQVERYAFQEPYGEGPASVRLTGLTFRDYTTTSWLRHGRDVDFVHVQPDGTLGGVLWSGHITAIDFDGNDTVIGCDGALAGSLAVLLNQPYLYAWESDLGLRGSRLIRRSNRVNHNPAKIGIASYFRGSRSSSVLNTLDEILGQAFTADGKQWTIARFTPVGGGTRSYRWQLKDFTTEHFTVTLGAPGITHSLRADLGEEPTTVYAEWTNPNGSRSRNAKWPNLNETPPPFPGTMSVGDTGTDVTVLLWEMYQRGLYPVDPNDTDAAGLDGANGLPENTYTEFVADIIRGLQDSVGLPVTGVVDAATWDAVWTFGAEKDAPARGAYFAPVASRSAVEPFRYSGNGSIIDANPAYNPDVLRVEQFLTPGSQITRADVVRTAKQLVNRSATVNWYGTVTLRTDPAQLHRLDIREGMNARLAGWPGDPLAHVAKVDVTGGAAPTVTLTVDTAGRDLVTVAQMLERAEANRNNAARTYVSPRRSNTVRDAVDGWEDYAGIVRPTDCPAGQWTVIPVLAAQLGTIQRVSLITDPPAEFAIAVFGRQVTASQLAERIGDPLAERTDGQEWSNNRRSNGWLEDRWICEAWGVAKNNAHAENPCGYSPGSKEDKDPLNGRLVDNGSWELRTDRVLMWVAVWPRTTTAIRGRFYVRAED